MQHDINRSSSSTHRRTPAHRSSSAGPQRSSRDDHRLLQRDRCAARCGWCCCWLVLLALLPLLLPLLWQTCHLNTTPNAQPIRRLPQVSAAPHARGGVPRDGPLPAPIVLANQRHRHVRGGWGGGGGGRHAWGPACMGGMHEGRAAWMRAAVSFRMHPQADTSPCNNRQNPHDNQPPHALTPTPSPQHPHNTR